tara:strand:- start:399 stop:614 length:216 start_codon:yes stop_codon:yes gene_type:complete
MVEGETPILEDVVRNCAGCGHVSICTILRAFSPLLGQFAEEHRPFESDQLAVICTKWISLAAIEVLQGDHR